MTTFVSTRTVAASLAFGSLFVAAPLRAEDTAERCLAAHEKVQLDRASGDLLSAHEAASSCVKPECPAIVRNDCILWYSELGQEQPSLVITASQGQSDVLEGEVFIDDAPYAGALDGRVIPLNPGRHVVRLVVPGGEPLTKIIVLAVGEARRRVQFEVAPPPPPPARPVTSGDARPEDTPGERPIPSLTYALAGVSAAAFLVGGTFGVVGLIERDGSTCAPNCSESTKSSVDTKFLVADVAYGVGLATGIAALVTYLVRPTVRAPEGPSSGFTGVVTPQLAYVGYRGLLP